MAKSRDKVQQQGLWDDEVTKPDHDAVCLWAYNNALQIARAVRPDLFGRAWTDKDVSWRVGREGDIAERAAAEFMAKTERPEPRIAGRVLECVLTSTTGFRDQYARTVGFADLVFRISTPVIAATFRPGVRAHADDVFDGIEVGWDQATRVLVEAKSVMPTLGEMLRQIRHYQTAFDGPAVVVAPDDKYAEILADQGVTFVQCPSRL